MSRLPLLLGEPVPLPAVFRGAWEGASVVFNLDHALELQWERTRVLAGVQARQDSLTARRPALPADDDQSAAAVAARVAFGSDQRAVNRAYFACVAAYVVWGFTGGEGLPAEPMDAEAWERLPAPVVQWVAVEGLTVALQQVLAPFSTGADAPAVGAPPADALHPGPTAGDAAVALGSRLAARGRRARPVTAPV